MANGKMTPVQAHLWKWLTSPFDANTGPRFGSSERWLYGLSQCVVLHRLAFLEYASGQHDRAGRVQWGAIEWHTGPYGRVGLTEGEALELIYYYGRRDALIEMAPPAERDNLHLWFNQTLRAEVARVAQERHWNGDPE